MHNNEPQLQCRSQGIEQRATISKLFLTAIERELHLGRRDAHAQGRRGCLTTKYLSRLSRLLHGSRQLAL